MKNVFLIFLYSLVFISSYSQEVDGTPTWNETFKQKKTQKKYLAQQIALLQGYTEILKEGYKISQTGLKLVGDIKDGNYKDHQLYFNSLKQVKPSITKSPNVSRVLSTINITNKQLRIVIDQARMDGGYSEKEIEYLQFVCKNIRKDTDGSLKDLTNLLTEGVLVLKDDERLSQIDSVYKDVLFQFTASVQLSKTTQILAMERAREKYGIHTLRSLYTY